MDYDLELDKVILDIKKANAKNVLLQLPDGLKSEAKNIADRIQKDTGAVPFIWFGTCYGSCDVPNRLKPAGIDMLIQWGHSPWRFDQSTEK